MDNSKIEEYKRYKKKIEVANILIRFGILAIILSSVLALFFTMDNNNRYSHALSIFVIFLISFFILPIAIFPIRIKTNKIITEELDPWKLKYLLENKSLNINYTDDKYLSVAYFTGDYQEAINICSDKVKSKCKDKYFYLNWLSLTYFVLGDTVNLKIACSKFDDIASASKTDLYKIIPLQKHLSLFADGKHEELKNLYETEDLSNRVKSSICNFEYIHAVNFYKLGETEKAKELFEKIVNEAPLLNLCELSKEHLTNIENGEEYSKEAIILTPSKSSNTIKKVNKMQKAQKICSKIGIILSVTCLLFLWLGQCSTNKNLEDAIQKVHPDGELIDYFYLEKDGEKIETLLLIYSSENQLEIGYAVKYKETKETGYIMSAPDFKEGPLYITHGPVSDFDIYFKLCSDKKDIPDDCSQYFKVKIDGKTNYLCVTTIKECTLQGFWGHDK